MHDSTPEATGSAPPELAAAQPDGASTAAPAPTEFHVDGVLVRGNGVTDARHAPLLLVHGAHGGAWCWDAWLATLAGAGREAYALSLRGRPDSAAAGGGRPATCVADYVADLDAVVGHLGRPCVVVGWGLGGLVAQLHAAAAEPEALRALVLLAPVPPAEVEAPRVAGLSRGSVVRPSYEDLREQWFHGAGKEQVRAVATQLAAEPAAVLTEACSAPGVAVSATALHCPVLVLQAEYDEVVGQSGRGVAEHYGGEFRRIWEIGHAMPLDDGWEGLLRIALSWIDEKAPPQAATPETAPEPGAAGTPTAAVDETT